MTRQKQPHRRHAGHLQRSGAQLGRQRHMPATHLWLGREARRLVEPLGMEVDFEWRDRGVHQRPAGSHEAEYRVTHGCSRDAMLDLTMAPPRARSFVLDHLASDLASAG